MNNELQLYDIYGHWHVPFWQTSWFLASALACGLIALLVLLYCIFKKFFSARLLSPAQQALHDLEILKKKNITNQEDAQEAYFALTNILKKLFQAHYNKSFASMSDREMIAALKKTTMDTGHLDQLSALVDAGVMVKYAREHALQEDVLRAINNSISIIEQLMIAVKKSQ